MTNDAHEKHRRPATATVSDFVAANVDEHGVYENVSEYLRDLIRRDKTELALAFAAPESSYQPLTAAGVIARKQG